MRQDQLRTRTIRHSLRPNRFPDGDEAEGCLRIPERRFGRPLCHILICVPERFRRHRVRVPQDIPGQHRLRDDEGQRGTGVRQGRAECRLLGTWDVRGRGPARGYRRRGPFRAEIRGQQHRPARGIPHIGGHGLRQGYAVRQIHAGGQQIHRHHPGFGGVAGLHRQQRTDG